MPEMPLYGVMPTKKFSGRNSLDQISPLLEICTFDQAFKTAILTDAHFVGYRPVDGNGEYEDVWPRCNKPLLTDIRNIGGDIVLHTFALDFDTPGHKPWGETLTLDEFGRILDKAIESFPLLGSFAYLYTTTNGARLVYILDEPVPVDIGERQIRWMCTKARAAGLEVDILADWTRCFRLPMVERESGTTYEDPSFEVFEQLEVRLPTADLGQTLKGTESEYGEIVPVESDKPDDDEAAKLIETRDNRGRIRYTDWAKLAKKRLRGRECFPCLFEHEPIAEEGSRDATIHAHVGQAVALLMSIDGTTPDHVYALFLSPVLDLEPDEQTPDWTDVLWSAVCRLWAKQESKLKVKEGQEKAAEEKQLETYERVVEGVKEWNRSDELWSEDPQEVYDYVSSHLIAGCGTSYYLMRPDGKYSSQALLSPHLIASINRNLPELIQTSVPTATGDGMKQVAAQTLLNQHLTIVSSVEVEPCLDGGYIDKVDTDNARLILGGYRRNPRLSPQYSEEVDEWLHAMYGKHCDKACNWIARALAFEEGPICAKSIEAPQGVGKGLLTQGLAECLETPKIALAKDLVDKYQYGLLDSPFLVVNEGWPKGHSGKHPADSFRELTAGDELVIDRKFLNPVRVRNPVRVLFTANNLEVIKMLASHSDLGQMDRDALAIRLLHFTLDEGGAEWLKSKGGLAFTGREGSRWIAPAGTGKSDFVVARHFLWLYEQRDKWPRGDRFLVEGNGSDELMFEMQTQTGNAPLVIESLLHMINKGYKIEGLSIDEDQARIHVTSSVIVDYFRKHMASGIRGENLTTNKVGRVLTGLCLPKEKDEAYVLPAKPDMGRVRWHELDLAKLSEAAMRHGWKCKSLTKLVDKRKEMDK